MSTPTNITIPTTTLSAGKVIYAVLNGSLDVTSRVTKIFPVVASQNAQLPYISYGRTGLSTNPQKAGVPGADAAVITVDCYTENYMEGVEIAEIVRSLLEFQQKTVGTMRMRACTLVDSTEDWQDDAFVQSLTFQVRI